MLTIRLIFIGNLLMISSIALFSQKTIILDENFDDNKNNWYVGSTDALECKIKDGQYILDRKSSSGRSISFINIQPLNTEKEDYSVEMKVRQLKGAKNNTFGLIASRYKDGSSYEELGITSDGNLYVNDQFNGEKHVKVSFVAEAAIHKDTAYNILRIEKTSNIITFFVNDKMVYRYGSNSYFGQQIGICLERRSMVEVDYIKVSKSPEVIDLIEGYERIGKKYKLGEQINSEHIECSPRLTADGKTLFICRCDTTDGNQEDIWYSKRQENNEWGIIKRMKAPLNNKNNNFLVSISPDENTLLLGNLYGKQKGNGVSKSIRIAEGWSFPKRLKIKDFYNNNSHVSYALCPDNKTLLMAVERDGGLGQRDIYVSFLETDGSWSRPENLGPQINTFEEELAPFMALDNKTLYFSSRGHKGYGHFDIFVSTRLDNSWKNWSPPKNMGPKINSRASDAGIVIDAKGEEIYFESNNDIWMVDNHLSVNPTILIKGTVYNKKTKEPMDADIQYSDLKNAEEVGIASSHPTTGAYKIVLPAGIEYSYHAEKKGFYAFSEYIDLSKSLEYKEIEVDLYLNPIEKGRTFRLNNIFFEYNKASLKPESKIELNQLYNLLLDNPDLKIEIGGHTDSDGSDKYNRDLSQRRAEAVVKYLINKGVKKKRLKAKGYGETKAVVPNDSDANKAINRRVEFIIL